MKKRNYLGKNSNSFYSSNQRGQFGICMLLARFYPRVGGTEQQALYLAKELVNKGHRVFVCTQRFSTKLKKFELIGEVPVHRLFSLGRGRIASLSFMFCSIMFLVKKRNHYQIIHVHLASSPAITAVILGKLLQKKVIVKFGASREFGDIHTSEQRFIGKLKLEILKKYADCFIAPSKEIKEEMIQFGFSVKKVFTIPNGVDIHKFFPVTPERKSTIREKLELKYPRIVTFVGRLTKQKGLDFLIRGWRKICTNTFEIHLLLIGDGEERNNIENLIAQLKIQNMVHLLGNRHNIVDLLQASDIFILPSLAEGLSNALLEAMSCSLPVIATNIGGTAEIIENRTNGVLIELNSINQLYEGIIALTTNPELSSTLGRNARNTVKENYSIEKITQSYISLYEKVCK
ncbi:MAG TPA: hypothetical protein DHV62_05005 [Elusimicrobia bacterium]|jgi:glycosyltransferase involved in cell wall biosynthesis|nr:hypothetical protein [Elusimicrobiota bacterium]